MTLKMSQRAAVVNHETPHQTGKNPKRLAKGYDSRTQLNVKSIKMDLYIYMFELCGSVSWYTDGRKTE